jgi:hypothetical protein
MLENFKTAEFFDKETYELLGDQAMKLLDIRLKMTIDRIRKELGYFMIINTWSFRNWQRFGSQQWNDRCFRSQKSGTGAKEGSHYKGMGVDFDCYDSKWQMIPAKIVRKKMFDNIHLFPYIHCFEVGINWLHIDVMDEEASPRRTGIKGDNILLYDFRTKSSSVVTRDEISSYSE